MKKITVLVMIAMMVIVFSPIVLAKSDMAGTGGVTPTTSITTKPTIGVANQNQVKTQNAGEESQLMVSTAEQEEAGEDTMNSKMRSEIAAQNMGDVAKGVEDLLMSKTLKGGIGDQVKLLAQDQEKSQERVKLQIDKVASREGLLKSIIGPNYGALKDIETQLGLYDIRIEQLTELKTQLTNSGDIALVQKMIDSMNEQKTNLQDMIEAESNTKSVFGWLIRLFVK